MQGTTSSPPSTVRLGGYTQNLMGHARAQRAIDHHVSFTIDPFGGVRERPNRHAWKACVGQLTVGSNPTPSAKSTLFEPWR